MFIEKKWPLILVEDSDFSQYIKDSRYAPNEDEANKYGDKIGLIGKYSKLIEIDDDSENNIDIIAKDKDEYVFIEVKTRSNIKFGRPKEAVNEPKQKHIYKSTKFYLYLHKLNNAFIRFDVIEVYFTNERYKLKHLKQVEIKG